ncbi:MAG: ribosome silencing factor [Lactobacillus sp.]|nr:ribosome silencing factor [Lactobacillus sp.]MCO6543084.1 ribosome silencing factor [Lactobacillus sp.]
MNSKEIMQAAVKAAADKRAENIIVLDMQQTSLMADYFVIASATSQRQVQAIVDNITEQSESVNHVEGQKDSPWILVDMGDVIVHVFTQEAREFYKIESLWSDVPTVDVTELID